MALKTLDKMDILTFIVLISVAAVQSDFIQPPSVRMVEPELLYKSQFSTAEFDLVCRASGYPIPKISWYKDDKPVPGGDVKVTPEGNLKFAKGLTTEYEGKYQCRAENMHGVSQSNLTELNLAFFNVINFPTNTIVTPIVKNEGEYVKLPCTYSDPLSNPTPIWSWVKQQSLSDKNAAQTSVTLSNRLSVDMRGTLYIQNVKPGDNLQDDFHLCGGWNAIMGVTKFGSPQKLRIVPQANIPSRGPKMVYNNGPNIEVIAGEDINLYCIFEGYPTVDVKWTKLGNTAQPFYRMEQGKTKFVIPNSLNTDQYEGEYRCEGFQDSGNFPSVTFTFNVSVLQKPEFVQGPYNINVTEGGEVEFTCKAIAEPPATYTFYVNGVEVSQVVPSDARRTVVGNTYKFTGLRRGTAPQYTDSDLQVVTCMAQNKRPDGTEVGRSYMDGYVNVMSAMSFTMKPQHYNVTDKTERIVLDCEIKSDPGLKPLVSWHVDKVPVTLSQKKIEQMPNNSLFIYPGAFDKFDDVVGTYVCVAETLSPRQRITANATIAREGPPIAVTAASINLWWVGLILALLILLLIILLIICCIRRNGGGQTHDVDKVERQMGNDPVKDLQANGFKDYVPREKAPIEGKRDLEDFSLEAIDNQGYNEDNDSLEQYAVDAYPGEYGTAPGRTNPAYTHPGDYPPAYNGPGYGGHGYGDPGYGMPITYGNTGYVPDEADV